MSDRYTNHYNNFYKKLAGILFNPNPDTTDEDQLIGKIDLNANFKQYIDSVFAKGGGPARTLKVILEERYPTINELAAHIGVSRSVIDQNLNELRFMWNRLPANWRNNNDKDYQVGTFDFLKSNSLKSSSFLDFLIIMVGRLESGL